MTTALSTERTRRALANLRAVANEARVHRLEEWVNAASDWIMQQECVRVSGDVVCEECGQKYYDHHEVEPGFHLLCDGRLGKT